MALKWTLWVVSDLPFWFICKRPGTGFVGKRSWNSGKGSGLQNKIQQRIGRSIWNKAKKKKKKKKFDVRSLSPWKYVQLNKKSKCSDNPYLPLAILPHIAFISLHYIYKISEVKWLWDTINITYKQPATTGLVLLATLSENMFSNVPILMNLC